MKPSIRVQLFASPIVNLLSLFGVDLKSKVDCTSYKLCVRDVLATPQAGISVCHLAFIVVNLVPRSPTVQRQSDIWVRD